jgi:hypothetical protein
MYITYTFLFGANLAGLLVLKVLGAVVLLVTFLLAVEARDVELGLGHLRRAGNVLVAILRLLALRALCLPTGFHEIRGLDDHQHSVPLDFYLNSLDYSKQLRQGF